MATTTQEKQNWIWIIVGLILFTIFFPSILNISKLIKKLTGFLSGVGTTDKNDEEFQGIVNNMESKLNWNKTSLNKEQVTQLALEIFDACTGVGTDNSQLNSALSKLKNSQDAIALYVVYGVRDLSAFGDWTFTSQALDLMATFKAELGGPGSAESIKLVKEKFKDTGILIPDFSWF